MQFKSSRILEIFQKIPAIWKNRRLNWENIKNSGDTAFQAGWRLVVLLLLIGIVVFLFKGLRYDGYSIAAFQSPATFVDAGFSGPVLAKKLVDKLHNINLFVSSVKDDVLEGIQSDVDRPDLNVEVMGIGLTLNSVTYHLREILGRQNRTIGGELTDIDQTLSLTLRMTGFSPRTFSYTYEKDGRAEALEYLLDQAAKQVINHLDPYRMAVYHYKKKENKESLEIIGEILRDRPQEAAWAYLAWGNLLNQQKKTEEAIEKFQRATQIDPQLRLAWSNWGWAEFGRENVGKAIEIFRHLTEMDPKAGYNWNSLAFCYRQLNRYEEAEKAHSMAVKVEPQNIWWYGNWADFKFQQGDTAGVMKILDQMNKNIEWKGVDYFLAAASYQFFLGHVEEAKAQYENILILDPNNIQALRQLMAAEFQSGKNFSKTKEYARRLIPLAEEQNEQRPELFRQTIYNYLAMADYKLEQFDSAMIHVQLAIEQDTSVAYPYTTLAEVYGLTGNDEAFYKAVETALAKGFSNLNNHLEEQPYKRYAKEDRFIKLLDRYSPKESSK